MASRPRSPRGNGLDYEVVDYPLFEGRHLTAEFRKLNPNCKLPALVDDAPSFGGRPLPVFETGAILLYLAEKSGHFIPADPRARIEALKWLVWQVAGHGPMNRQAHHFMRYAPEGQDYAVSRYLREVVRLLNVLEYRLSEVDYLAGDYSIADMAVWPRVWGTPLLGIDLGRFDSVSRWFESVGTRPAVQRATTSEKTGIP